MKNLQFPKDEKQHNHIIEWWYINGHVHDTRGNTYSYMNCLFRADVKKIKIPFLSKLPGSVLYFSHSLISNIKKKKFYPHIDLSHRLYYWDDPI